jgi:uncharacterized membrane protein YkoI
MRRKLAFGAAVVLVFAAAATGIAIAAGGDDEQPLTGATYDRATAAALRHTGGGTVTETETGDDGAAYEVEVRLSNGRQVEVQLDENFRVLGREADDDTAGENESRDDD